MPTIQGVFAYVNLQKPVLDFKKVKKEYKLDLFIDEDQADEWSENFPKQPAKSVKTAEFEDIYKFKPPFPKEKKQYFITLRQTELWPDGKARTGKDRPKAFIKIGETEDGKPLLKDVTESVLVGNGSVGVVSYTVSETTEYGNLAYLKNIRVDELIEYVPKVQEQEEDDDFGVEEDSGEDDFDSTPKATEKEPKKVQSARKGKPAETDDNEPF